ncbi:hypothetical protein PBAC_32640 [Pedobacter glucosidilyticus]|nr:hypothetical protein PBAC_32640 [Pedobacter glucosidilyticus]
MPLNSIKFKSQKSYFITFLVFLPLIGIAFILIFTTWKLPLYILPMLMFTNIIRIVRLCRCHYIISNQKDLIINFGPNRKTIPIKSITSITEVNRLSLYSWFVSWSHDTSGLLIFYHKSSKVVISPENREEFKALLEALRKV